MTDALSKLEISLIFCYGTVNFILIETGFWTAKLMGFPSATVAKSSKTSSYLSVPGARIITFLKVIT